MGNPDEKSAIVEHPADPAVSRESLQGRTAASALYPQAPYQSQYPPAGYGAAAGYGYPQQNGYAGHVQQATPSYIAAQPAPENPYVKVRTYFS